MNAGDICQLETIVIQRDETAFDAAMLMNQYNVGSLVVVIPDTQGNKPVGIITDRDITLKVVAARFLPEAVSIDNIMNPDLMTVSHSSDIYSTLQQMRYRGVRRAPVLDEKGYLLGILSLDDVLEYLIKEMGEIVNLLHKERSWI